MKKFLLSPINNKRMPLQAFQKMHDLLPITIILTIAILSVFFFSACDLTDQQYFETQDIYSAEEQSDSVTVYEFDGDHLERKITARFIERYYEDEKIEAYDVNIIDFNLDKTIRMILDADHLTIDEAYNLYTARDNVVIRHENATLYTQLMTWNQNIDEIYAPDEVIVVRGENVIRGFELRTDVDFNSLELSRVTAEGRLEDEDFEDIDW